MTASTLSCYRVLLKAWEDELEDHDTAMNCLRKMPGYELLAKNYAKRRKRILWNITRIKNLIKKHE